MPASWTRLKYRGSIMLVVGGLLGAASGLAIGESGRVAERTRVADLEARLSQVDTMAMSGSALVSVEAERGWQVAVFAPPVVHNGGAWAESDRDVGRFVHAASWIELEEHRQHDGIFLSGPAGLHLTSLAYAGLQGDYELALHMIVAPRSEGAANSATRRLVTCYATAMIDDHHRALDGEIDVVAEVAASRGGLIGPPIRLRGDAWHHIDVRISCSLPAGIRGTDVTLQLCWRPPGETGFQPVDGRVPTRGGYQSVADQGRAVAGL